MKALVPLVYITAMILGSGLMVACDRPSAAPVASDFMQGIEGPVVFGMVSYLTASGVREGRIEADTAFTHADTSRVDLRGMSVVFYDEVGLERATVSGHTGEWNPETDQMIARGEVLLFVHRDSSNLRSQEIHYDPESDRIWRDSATIRTLANGTVTSGSSFESDIEFENIVVRDPRGGVQRIF